jgi:hypothetical protein
MPTDPGPVVQQFYLAHGGAVRMAALLQVLSAIPLALWATAAGLRGHKSDRTREGTVVAWFGGWCAAMLLLLNGLCSWVAADLEVAASAANVRALQLMSFALGGPAFAVLFAMLITGVLISRHAGWPGWLIALGVVCASCGLLAAFTLVTIKAAVFIPLTRFGGFVWLLAGARRLHAAAP